MRADEVSVAATRELLLASLPKGGDSERSPVQIASHPVCHRASSRKLPLPVPEREASIHIALEMRKLSLRDHANFPIAE